MTGSGGHADRVEESSGWNLELSAWEWLDWFEEGDRKDMALDQRKRDIDARLENVGWGLVLLLLGALALPNGTTQYVVVVILGGALIGLNGVRMSLGIPIAWFGLILGAALLIAAVGALAGTHMDVFVPFFAIAGVVTILRAITRPTRSGETEVAGEA